MMKFVGIFLLLILTVTAGAQEVFEKPDTLLPAKVINGDTVVFAPSSDLFVQNDNAAAGESFDPSKYRRLVYNVKKVYPYAKLARFKFEEMERNLATMTDEKQKQAYIDKTYKEVREQFEDELKKLTVSQGRILIRLLDRETDQTAYQIVKQFLGGFRTTFWQSLARVFGSNLKSEYDPTQGEDMLIEQIIQRIEAGEL